MKPFKPPTLLNRLPSTQPVRSSEPPTKRRRISLEDDEDDTAKLNLEATAAAAKLLRKPEPAKGFIAPVRKPLHPVRNPSSSASEGAAAEESPETYYNVLWRKFTTKKNKTWDGDGILVMSGSSAILKDESGKVLGKGVCKGLLLVGSELSIGGKEIEVDSMIPREEYTSGRIFLGTARPAPPPSLKDVDGSTRITKKAQAKYEKIAATQKEQRVLPAVASTVSKTMFKTPLLQNSVQAPKKNTRLPTPRHDPTVKDALVMTRPRSVPKGKQIVDVVVDPVLTKCLREHQREGVAFLYDCVMGLKDYDGEGAILADEMGLGKTLQTIALLWTLLKQNPVYEDPPLVKKALIVCPVTLINNWRKEIRKWLGSERIGIFVPEGNKARLTDFTKGRAYQVMIIGYEKLTKVQEQLQGNCGIDIIICDEGHRLKTAKNKAAAAIRSIDTERRIILSGTPVQNDLEEFYQMVDFCNPSIMSKYSTFKREFETPIVKSRQPEATAKDIEKGEARSAELAELTGKFILRRTAEILSKYLPPKTEYVVFCKPTTAQATIYRSIVGSSTVSAALNSSGNAMMLELINVLKKVCNSPTLLTKPNDKDEGTTRPELLEGIPAKYLNDRGASGKFQVLDELLHNIKVTGEKVVLVSNYTSTMDILAQLLTSLDYKYLRLDGKTPQNKRQGLVDQFNRSPQSNSFVFLLSAKAGGVGLNLVGASRLILYDLDWNPTTDLQAMARVHRDGQKRPCYIYRLITQGVLDEKIFQRQVSKTGLADSIVDGKANANGFTQAELRDLFTMDESAVCQTHELLGCNCGGSGTPMESSAHPIDDSDSTRNDLASLSEQENGVEVLRLDGDDEEGIEFLSRKFTTAQKAQQHFDAEEAEFQRSKTAKTKMLSLMQYTHFNTSRANEKILSGSADEEEDIEQDVSALDLADTVIEDEVLRKVIRSGDRVGFVFSKLSSQDQLT